MNENNSHLAEEWWTNDLKDLIEDQSKIWVLSTFKSTIGFWMPTKGCKILGKVSQHSELPQGSIIDDKAWDHEHCELCRETIAEYENFQHEGYSDGDKWLWFACYNRYIVPRRKNI